MDGFGAGGPGHLSMTTSDHAVTSWLISNDDSDPLQWLAELTRRPAWHARAACRGTDPAKFVLGRGANANTMARARAVCATCPVSEPCLSYALADCDCVGVWSGTTAV